MREGALVAVQDPTERQLQAAKVAGDSVEMALAAGKAPNAAQDSAGFDRLAQLSDQPLSALVAAHARHAELAARHFARAEIASSPGGELDSRLASGRIDPAYLTKIARTPAVERFSGLFQRELQQGAPPAAAAQAARANLPPPLPEPPAAPKRKIL